MDRNKEVTSQEDLAARIFELSNHKVDPDTAQNIWSQILQHKWVLSEKIGRDVGIKVACVDFIDNIVSLKYSVHDEQRVHHLKRLRAKILDKSAWQTISESQPPKLIVEKRIVLPLTEANLAEKHGVSPPRTIIFFGPPGTGNYVKFFLM